MAFGHLALVRRDLWVLFLASSWFLGCTKMRVFFSLEGTFFHETNIQAPFEFGRFKYISFRV